MAYFDLIFVFYHLVLIHSPSTMVTTIFILYSRSAFLLAFLGLNGGAVGTKFSGIFNEGICPLTHCSALSMSLRYAHGQQLSCLNT